MLLGAEQLGTGTTLPWQRPVAFVLGGLLVVLALYAWIFQQPVIMPPAGEIPPGYGSPAAVGELLYTSYLLPFEVISVLLLAAMVGAIVLSKKQGSRS
jgi:NADH-quinone oxidoreductase subunit J